MLGLCTDDLQKYLDAVKVYEFRYGHLEWHTNHLISDSVCEWAINAYWQDRRFEC